MIDVAEAVGTKYITRPYTAAFVKVLTSNPNETYDIGKCRLGLSAVMSLEELYGKVNIINTKDEVLDGYLQENARRAKLPRIPDMDRIDLRIPYTNIDDVYEFIENLKVGIPYRYRVAVGQNYNYGLAVLTLIILTRPEVTVDLRFASGLFDFIRDEWLYSAKHHDKYWELDLPNLIVREVKGGFIKVPYRNEMSEELYRETFRCFPYEFGTEYLYEDEEWSKVVDKCFDILTKPPVVEKTIKDFVTLRQED